MSEKSIREEFEEFDREVAVSEIRLKRGRMKDRELELYFAHCRSVLPLIDRRLAAILDRRKDEHLERLDRLAHGD